MSKLISEEQRQIEMEQNNVDVLTAYNKIPYSLLNQEAENGSDVLAEFTQICKYYKVYKQGKKFTAEGTNGDYIASSLKYKMSSSLINKEARFLFAESPDITVEPKGDLGAISDDAKNSLTVMNDLVKTILDDNKFEEQLLKAAKDCFIGKRVAGLINFNEEDGVTLSFLPSTQFLYETRIGNQNVLTKFVCYFVIKEASNSVDKRIFKKKFVLEEQNGKYIVFLEEALYDGQGSLIEEVTEYQPTLLESIPAVIFINDGLTGETSGESEIELLQSFEEYYSKFSNADMDSERKSMNPIRYTVDMESNSTKNLSSSAGSQWDLGSDQNLDKPHPMVGMLEPSMSYHEALKITLDRIKTVGYEQVDMPNITLETMTGAITSGKALKAVYWPLIVRCKEKMKMWGPNLASLVKIIIDGAIKYPNCVKKHTNDMISPVDYEVSVVQNTPLPEDEIEEKNIDLAEVQAQVMSRKSYMKKWRGLTDDEVQEELEQIAFERQMIEDVSFNGSFQTNNMLGSNEESFEVIEDANIKA